MYKSELQSCLQNHNPYSHKLIKCMLKTQCILKGCISIQVLPGKLLKGPTMAWCEVHTLLIVHKINLRFISYLNIYIFIISIYVKELTGYKAIDWVSVFC